MGSRSTITLDARWLRRVYDGPDPDGFARFVADCAASPDALVYADQPATLGIMTVGAALYDFTRVARGHHLHGDWRIVRWFLDAAREMGAQAFVYPVRLGRPNSEKLARVLTRRLGFAPYEHIYLRRL